jgi:anti-anti-sigma factor
VSTLTATTRRTGRRRTLVALAGELDRDSAGRLADVLAGALPAERPGVLELNFAHVTFLDAAGVHVLVRGHALARAAGHRLVVGDPQPVVRRVLEICRLLTTFEVDEGRR